MAAQHVVLLFGVAVAVLVIAAYLITIVALLKSVHDQLIVILGVVSDVYGATEGIDVVVDEIRTDLAGGREALDACVNRLRDRMGVTEPAPGDGVGARAFSAD